MARSSQTKSSGRRRCRRTFSVRSLRLSSGRASGVIGPEFDALIDRLSAELDAARVKAGGLRGDARAALLSRLEETDGEMLATATKAHRPGNHGRDRCRRGCRALILSRPDDGRRVRARTTWRRGHPGAPAPSTSNAAVQLSMPAQGDVLSLVVERPAVGGPMIARADGQIVLVTGAIPGERVQARIDRVARSVAFATTIDVRESSPDRRDALRRSLVWRLRLQPHRLRATARDQGPGHC